MSQLLINLKEDNIDIINEKMKRREDALYYRLEGDEIVRYNDNKDKIYIAKLDKRYHYLIAEPTGYYYFNPDKHGDTMLCMEDDYMWALFARRYKAGVYDMNKLGIDLDKWGDYAWCLVLNKNGTTVVAHDPTARYWKLCWPEARVIIHWVYGIADFVVGELRQGDLDGWKADGGRKILWGYVYEIHVNRYIREL